MNIDAIIKNVAGDLVRMYHRPSEIALVFPRYRDNSSRISEQESKLLFSKYFFENNIKFAIEAPTETVHSFSGKIPKSARSDMLTYNNNLEQDVEWMIELKKGVQEKEIRKDFEKMVVSNKNCLWFQTLVKSTEILDLLEKMNRILEKEIAHHEGSHTWKVAVVVLQTGHLYLKNILLNDRSFNELNLIKFEKEPVLKIDEEIDEIDSSLFPKSGKNMVYVPDIEPKTFLHFSWGRGSGHLRNYSLSDIKVPLLIKEIPVSKIRALIKERIAFNKKNAPDIKDVKYWHEKTIELNIKYKIY